MTSQNLKGKLRAIQELKAEKYIGTKEAWDYLDRVNALYENPKLAADSINKELEKQTLIYFRATPERIMGLGDFFDIVLTDFNEIELKTNKNLSRSNGLMKLDSLYSDSPLTNYKYLICGENPFRNPKKLTEYLLPIFENVQIKHTTNRLFGIYAVNYTLNNFDLYEREINFFLEKANNINWDYLLSLENFRDMEKKLKREIFQEEIDITNRTERMYRDQVDNRLENRREILTDYIIQNNIDSYDSLREDLKRIFQNRQKLIEELKILNPHEIILNKQERLIKESKFLLIASAPERNFINKYLKS